MEKPLRYSWIIEGRLAVGERPRRLADLLSLGFGAVLSLQEEGESAPQDDPPPALRYVRVPIVDGLVGGVPSLAQIQSAVASIQDFQEAGLLTYVHCFAGVGRSPTVCAAYLARAEGLSLREAVRRVARSHPPTDPTAGQLTALAQFLGSLPAPAPGGPRSAPTPPPPPADGASGTPGQSPRG